MGVKSVQASLPLPPPQGAAPSCTNVWWNVIPLLLWPSDSVHHGEIVQPGRIDKNLSIKIARYVKIHFRLLLY